MNWEIALGIFALVAFVVSIGKIIANNTKAMTEMRVSLDELKEDWKESKEDVKKLQEAVAKIITRLTLLESRKE